MKNKSVLCFFLFLFLLPVQGIGAAPCTSFDACFDSARDLFKEDRFQESLSRFEEAEKYLDKSQNSAGFYNAMGWTAYKTGNFEKARTLLEQALAQALKNKEKDSNLILKIYNNLGIVEFMDDNLDKAKGYFSSKDTSGSDVAKYYLGEIQRLETEKKANDHILSGLDLQLKKEYDQALEEYEKALALSPDNARALGYKGKILYLKKEYKSAVAILEKAYGKDQTAPAVISDLIKSSCAAGPEYKTAATELFEKSQNVLEPDSELCTVCAGIITCPQVPE